MSKTHVNSVQNMSL